MKNIDNSHFSSSNLFVYEYGNSSTAQIEKKKLLLRIHINDSVMKVSSQNC